MALAREPIASLWRTANRGDACPQRTESMSPPVLFAVSLALLAFAGRELAAACRALGIPDPIVKLIESLALG